MDLGVKFLDFDSSERCLVLDLDSRYDLILGMAWLERHEPWIDWRSKTLGVMRYSPGGGLASHEPTSARTQKHFWCEHWTESVNVIDIGVSKLVDAEYVERERFERGSGAERGTARLPLRKCGVAHNPLSGGCRSSSSSLGVGRDTGALRELNEVTTSGAGMVAESKVSSRQTTSAKMRQRRRALTVRRKSSELARVENGVSSGMAPRENEQLYTLVNGVTGDVDGNISLDALPALEALLEPDKISLAEFGEAQEVGELADVVVIRPEEELNSSSLLDETVLEVTKKTLNARSGSAILKDPSGPFY
ncbi:hypothetical protein ON010_g17010 [Phytophthora cinnamomi]|nr:hypothetical protein ON010_g17010 [Phytophthora cinnamomi]